MTSDLSERMDAVERLTKLFRAERVVYLIITVISFIMLCASTFVVVFIREKAGPAELGLIFGSTGLMGFTIGRIILMWTEALKRLLPSSDERKGKE